MSATNSRIAHLRRIRLGLQEEYWGRKANHTAHEAYHFSRAMFHLDELIDELIKEEKLRGADYRIAT